jgi:hypothetical protein
MSDNLHSLARQFHALFAGMERAHGSYQDIDWEHATEEGKVKGNAVTLRVPVTDELWEKHLAGKYGLGVICIKDDSTCVFGAIDIDQYAAELNHKELAAKIAKMELPLIVCRSKSGGAHLLLFSTESVPSKKMQDRLKDIAASLGHGTAEIFPKQTTKREGEDLGSWLNMPFFNHEKTNRYAVLATGDHLNADEFLALAQLSKQPPAWFEKPLSRAPDHLPDGPPCLNHLINIGFPAGTWDTGTFNLGVYCRKARPDDWQQYLAELNAINFPPDKWPVSDLASKIKSLAKKKYQYQCSIQPLAGYCDKAACKHRKFGVGAENFLPDLSSLSVLMTDPPIWYLELEGYKLKFATEELLNPITFQVKCANCNISVPWVGRADWSKYIGPFSTKANRIPIAEDGAGGDFSAESHFLELFETFLTGRVQGHSMGEVLLNKPYSTGGRTYFRISALQTFLNRNHFKDLKRNELVSILRTHKATNQQQQIGSQTPRVWSVPGVIRKDDPLPLPSGIGDQGEF